MWFSAVLPTRIETALRPGFTSRVTSSRNGGHHTAPAGWPLIAITAASRIGASSQVRIPGPRLFGVTAVPGPKSSTTAAPAGMAGSSRAAS